VSCSFEAVKRRIARRGRHRDVLGCESNAARIVDAVHAAMYDEGRQDESFFGMSADELREALSSSEIV
jgi:hypothetical protein